MPQTKPNKPRRNLPQHITRAVNARDGNRCRICGVETEFLHYDHVFPHDLGGPTTVENIQRLCPTCNTSKGNKIQCHRCRHWMSPDNSKRPQCEARFPYSKHSQTLAGKLEIFFQRVGKAVVIGGAVVSLLVLLTGGFMVARYFSGSSSGPVSEQSTSVVTVVNDSFDASASRPASFKVSVPANATNARVVGGYKMTGGANVNFYILDSAQFEKWFSGASDSASLTQRLQTPSAKIRQVLQPGTYYLVFAGNDDSTKVAAEFYLKHD